MFSWLAHVFYMYHLWELQVFVNQGSYCLCDDINNLFLNVTNRCKVRLHFLSLFLSSSDSSFHPTSFSCCTN